MRTPLEAGKGQGTGPRQTRYRAVPSSQGAPSSGSVASHGAGGPRVPYSLTHGQAGCCQLGAVVHQARTNIRVEDFYVNMNFSFPRHLPEAGTERSVL